MSAGKSKGRKGMAVAHLYVAHSGQYLSGWWETEPPEPSVKDPYPRFRPPDIFYEGVRGTLISVLDDLLDAGIIKQRFQWIVISSVWAKLGVQRAAKAQTKHQGPKLQDPRQRLLFEDTTNHGRGAQS